MASIRSVGFDMDHTLVPYKSVHFETLAFAETLKKFIESGYPEELASLRFNPDFVIRGLLVDRERGNVLKADCHKYVKMAFHGHRKLGKEERHRLYNSERIEPTAFLSIDSFFALSEVQLFTEIVDYMRLHPGEIPKTYAMVYQDLRKFIDLSHSDGSIKRHVLADPGKYVVKDPAISQALVRWLDGDKVLFLMTNSGYDYTDALMSYLFDDAHADFSKWQDFFQYIIVGAAKPSFFTGTQSFFEVISESGLLKNHSGPLELGKPYQGGNARLFQELTDQKGDEILYCGDHMYVDIIRSKESFNWRTLLVVDELEENLKDSAKKIPFLRKISQQIENREIQDEKAQRLRSLLRSQSSWQKKSSSDKNSSRKSDETRKELKIVEGKIQILDCEIKQLIKEYEKSIHKIWGGLFKVGLEKSRFAKQLEEYACLYTASISNLRFYNPNKRFTSAHDRLPHDSL